MLSHLMMPILDKKEDQTGDRPNSKTDYLGGTYVPWLTSVLYEFDIVIFSIPCYFISKLFMVV